MLVLAAVEEVTERFPLAMNKQTLWSLFIFFFNRKGGGIKQRNMHPSRRNRTLCLLKAQHQLRPQSFLTPVLLLKKPNPPAVRRQTQLLMDSLVPEETHLEAAGIWHTWRRKQRG